MLTVMGLAVAAGVLSSIPAQASGRHSFVSNGVQTFVNGFVDSSSIPGDSVTLSYLTIYQTSNKNFTLSYGINDTAGTINDSGFGSIPASSVNVSGGSLNSDKEVVTLNLNTCDPAEFIAIFPTQGSCGPINITWTEQPASLVGSFAERSNIVQTLPNGEKTVQIGNVVGQSALVTGTAFGYSNTGGPGGALIAAN
jgi:hypothetical protein